MLPIQIPNAVWECQAIQSGARLEAVMELVQQNYARVEVERIKPFTRISDLELTYLKFQDQLSDIASYRADWGSELTVCLQLDRQYITLEERLNPDLCNLLHRIEKHQPLLDDLLLKNHRFQNIFNLMQQNAVPEDLILSFLMGKASLEECLSNETWMINFLVRSYEGLETSYFSHSHYLERSLTNLLSTILDRGIFESSKKTGAKTTTLIRAITLACSLKSIYVENADFCDVNLSGASFKKAGFKNVRFCGANLSQADFQGANLNGVSFEGANLFEANFSEAETYDADFRGSNLGGVKSTDPEVLLMKKEQAFEKYKLLPHVIGEHFFQGNKFPSELINRIANELI